MNEVGFVVRHKKPTGKERVFFAYEKKNLICPLVSL